MNEWNHKLSAEWITSTRRSTNILFTLWKWPETTGYPGGQPSESSQVGCQHPRSCFLSLGSPTKRQQERKECGEEAIMGTWRLPLLLALSCFLPWGPSRDFIPAQGSFLISRKRGANWIMDRFHPLVRGWASYKILVKVIVHPKVCEEASYPRRFNMKMWDLRMLPPFCHLELLGGGKGRMPWRTGRWYSSW